MPHKPGNGAIFGIVSEDGLVKEGSPVYLYDTRRDVGVGEMKLLSMRLTAADGGFEFAGLDPEYDGYMLTATDEDGVTPKNALIQDRIQPISSHVGAGNASEWYVQACQHKALGGWATFLASDDTAGNAQPLGIGASVVHTIPASQPSLVPSSPPVPEYPSANTLIHNTAGGVTSYGRHLSYDGSAGLTAEMLIDLDTVAALGVGEHAIIFVGQVSSRATFDTDMLWGRSTGSNGGSSESGMLLKFNPDLTVEAVIAPHISSSAANNMTAVDQGWVQVADLAGNTGLVHFVVVYAPLVSYTAYLNGATVGTVGTTHQRYGMYVSGTPRYPGRPLWSAVFVTSHRVFIVPPNDDKVAAGVPVGLALLMGYQDTLDASDVSKLYKALYDNDLVSPLSGFQREVFKHFPSVYYSLSDVDMDTGRVRSLTHPVLNDGTIEVETALFMESLTQSSADRLAYPTPSLFNAANWSQTPSPLAGRQALEFSQAAGAVAIAGAHAPFRLFSFEREMSFSCWFRPDTLAPMYPTGTDEDTNYPTHYAELFVMGATMYTSASNDHYTGRVQLEDTPIDDYVCALRIDQAGQLVFGLRLSGGWVNHTISNQTLVAGAWYFVFATMDTLAASPTLDVYIGTDAAAPTLVQSFPLAQGQFVETTAKLTTGSLLHAQGVVMGQHYHGALAEVALYPKRVDAADITALWTSKDTA